MENKNNNISKIVYSKNVIDFVTVANEYCKLLETVNSLSLKDFLTLVNRMLPLLYVKALMLPKVEFMLEEDIEKSVTEEHYFSLQHAILNLIGTYDDFQEVFVQGNDFDQVSSRSSVSEHLVDVYQDVKDFVFAYQIGVEEIMNDALANIVSSFELFWGQRLVNVLRACHNLLYGDENIDDNNMQINPTQSNLTKNNDWYNKFQNQWLNTDE